MSWGTPPLTVFTLTDGAGKTYVAYTTPAMLPSYGVQQAALNRVPNDVQIASCVSASSRADSMISQRYPLPLVAFDYDLVLPVAHIAIWLCLSNVGRNPEAGYDDQIDIRYEQAMAFLGHVQRQSANLNVLVNQPPSPKFNLPAVITGRQRGWTGRGRW